MNSVGIICRFHALTRVLLSRTRRAGAYRWRRIFASYNRHGHIASVIRAFTDIASSWPKVFSRYPAAVDATKVLRSRFVIPEDEGKGATAGVVKNKRVSEKEGTSVTYVRYARYGVRLT